jgi:hypothetical protein
LLFSDTVSFERHDVESTIDLVFFSFFLFHTFIFCFSREDLDHESDHYHIEISSVFSPHTALHVSKPLWKKADKVVLSLSARELDLFHRNFENCKDTVAGVNR